MEFLIAVLIKLFQMVFPMLLKASKDTCEDGSDKDADAFKNKVKSVWSDEAIAATNPKEAQ